MTAVAAGSERVRGATAKTLLTAAEITAPMKQSNYVDDTRRRRVVPGMELLYWSSIQEQPLPSRVLIANLLSYSDLHMLISEVKSNYHNKAVDLGQ